MNAFFELRIQISHERERASKRVRERERGGDKRLASKFSFSRIKFEPH